jgi:hypothetical protein
MSNVARIDYRPAGFWEIRPTRSSGKDWIIFDASHKRRTHWRRIRRPT